jgi:hypothetical protein
MTKLRKDKVVKEAARTKELSKRGPGGMNQEETAKATEENKRMQTLLKDAIKKKALEKASGERDGSKKKKRRSVRKRRRERRENRTKRRKITRRKLIQRKLQQVSRRRQGHRAQESFLRQQMRMVAVTKDCWI